MKHRNRMNSIVAMALAGVLFITNGMTAQAAFDDKDSSPTWDWAEKHIDWAKGKGIVAGKDNNCFDADGWVTRAEAATMLVKFKGIDATAYDTQCEQFEDVGEAWYTKYINAAYANELMSGKTETSFDPEGLLTRAEAATMIVKAMEYDLETENEGAFQDIEGEWYTNYINTAWKHEVVSGKEEGSFDPDADVSRAELVTMLHCTMKENFGIGKYVGLNLRWFYPFKFTNADGLSIYTGSSALGYPYGTTEEGDCFGGTLYPYVFAGVSIDGTGIVLMEPEANFSEYYIFETDREEIKSVGFWGDNTSVTVSGSNIDKIQVDVDGTVHLYGTDMQYHVYIENMAYDLTYDGTGSDVVLKVVDKQIVEVTE